MKNWKNWKLVLGFLGIAALGCSPRTVHAQFIGYTSPQTVQQTLATSVACSGINQKFVVTNLGQNQHNASLTVDASTTMASMFIQGQDAASDTFPISDTVFSVHTFASSPAVTASGYFPVVNVIVNCNTGGHFTLNYSGTSAQSNVFAGAYQNGAIDKALFQFQGQGLSVIGPQFVPPFSNSLGEIVFQYQNTAVTGSTLAISCVANGVDGAFLASPYTFTLAAVTTMQTFFVPAGICPLATVTYSSGGASIQTFSADYLLLMPGQKSAPDNYTHITGTTATTAKAGSGILDTLTIGTPAAGTISLFDLVP